MCDKYKNWKLYAGAGFFILACIADISFLIVPFLGFSGTTIVSFMTILAATGEGAFLISIMFLGKTLINKIKEKFILWFRRPQTVVPVHISRKRHLSGLWLFFISFLVYPFIEISLLMGYPESGEHLAYFFMLIAGDFIFVISLFVLGEPFWEKLKDLFRQTR